MHEVLWMCQEGHVISHWEDYRKHHKDGGLWKGLEGKIDLLRRNSKNQGDSKQREPEVLMSRGMQKLCRRTSRCPITLRSTSVTPWTFVTLHFEQRDPRGTCQACWKEPNARKTVPSSKFRCPRPSAEFKQPPVCVLVKFLFLSHNVLIFILGREIGLLW